MKWPPTEDGGPKKEIGCWWWWLKGKTFSTRELDLSAGLQCAVAHEPLWIITSDSNSNLAFCFWVKKPHKNVPASVAAAPGDAIRRYDSWEKCCCCCDDHYDWWGGDDGVGCEDSCLFCRTVVLRLQDYDNDYYYYYGRQAISPSTSTIHTRWHSDNANNHYIATSIMITTSKLM